VEEKRKVEEAEEKQLKEEWDKALAKQRAAEVEEKKQKVEEKKQKAEEKKQKAEEKKQKAEEKKQKVEEKKQKVEEKKQKAEEKKQKVEEKQRMEGAEERWKKGEKEKADKIVENHQRLDVAELSKAVVPRSIGGVLLSALTAHQIALEVARSHEKIPKGSGGRPTISLGSNLDLDN